MHYLFFMCVHACTYIYVQLVWVLCFSEKCCVEVESVFFFPFNFFALINSVFLSGVFLVRSIICMVVQNDLADFPTTVEKSPPFFPHGRKNISPRK